MTPITIKADWHGATVGHRGDTLYANDLNNNFNSIQQAVNNLIAAVPSITSDLQTNSITTVAGATIGGDLSVTGHALLSGNPTAPLGATTKQYVDALVAAGPSGLGVLKTGDDMTGPLVLAGDPTVALGAATKQYADRMLPLGGGTMTGPITLSADPAQALHPATKQYVDGRHNIGSLTPRSTFFVQNGATLGTVNDRLFVGGATANDGRFPYTSPSWIDTQFPPHDTIVGPAQFACLTTTGMVAGVFGSRSGDSTDTANTPIGVGAFVVNDNASQPQTCYALYGEARHKVSVPGQETITCELDIANVSGLTKLNNPYAMAPEQSSIGLWVASGGRAPGAIDASLAIGIQNNGAGFNNGIVFAADAITGTDGIADTTGIAVLFAKGHAIEWCCNSSGSIIGTSAVVCTVSDPAAATRIIFTNTGFQVNTVSQVLLSVAPTSLAAGQTTLSLLVSNNAGSSVVPVTLGAPDSGGTGYRALRVPN